MLPELKDIFIIINLVVRVIIYKTLFTFCFVVLYMIIYVPPLSSEIEVLMKGILKTVLDLYHCERSVETSCSCGYYFESTNHYFFECNMYNQQSHTYFLLYLKECQLFNKF